ncbi:MAG: tRNA 2-thiouridine(34) synthase MnmA [Pirellulales bacterium]|nr:tRNA 2-thiouridine(34) synthase MnmA [Pirellulales bacterium]
MPRVVLAMSGGVDSSIAAHLLLEQGHDVTGVFMDHGQTSPARGTATCPADQELGRSAAAASRDAQLVADQLGIPLDVIDFRAEFQQIIDYFVSEYTSGRTPNPCIVCNQRIKFGKLFDYADRIGAAFVATGHYARIGCGADGTPSLRRGIDVRKDQSYALFGIRRELLPRILFPIGEYKKPQIRALATDLKLRVADQRDSQEICFINNDDYIAFIAALRPPGDASGEMITTDGTLVGRHDGIEGFTIGQRKGLGIALGQPRYVVRIEADSRRVVLGTRHELARAWLTASGANWHRDPSVLPGTCLAQIRYMAPAVQARITVLPDQRFRIDFDRPQIGIAPGQAVVCYAGDQVLGGGWID